MTNLADAPPQRRAVLALDDLTHPAESERADRRLLVDRCRDPALREAQTEGRRALRLAGAGLLHRRFGSRPRGAHDSTSTGAAASGCEPAPPRRLRISSAFFSRVSPSNVALMTLCGFVVRSDFVRMSWMPTDSSTARTGPPAMTPVPGAAGFRSTRPAPYRPSTAWGIVVPFREICCMFFLAISIPFLMAIGTSFALPEP